MLIKGTKFRDILHGTGGNDAIYGYDSNDDLHGGFSNDLLVGGNGNDKLYGEAGNDTLDGGAGNDTLEGGMGYDHLKGGSGNDTYVLGSGIDQVIDTGGVDTITSSIGRSLVDNSTIERLTLLGDFNVSAIGNSLANLLTGNTGDNLLDGGSGADVLHGGLGDDTYVLANGTDAVVDSGGHDEITSTIARSLLAYAVIEDLTLTGISNVNATGNSLANTLTGNAGNNVLDGGAGVDSLHGGLGNDTYVLGNANDFVVDDGGTDTITSTITRTLVDYSEIEGLTLLGTANINATGNDRSNTLTGNSGNNILEGGAGTDTLIGGDGDDTYIVDTINLIDSNGDTVVESAGGGSDTVKSSVDYTLFNNIENLILTGADDSTATGNELDNAITGNGSANLIDGSIGADSMAGGLGDDTYVVDNDGDQATEGEDAGTDTVNSSVSFTLSTNVENLVLTGTTGINGTGNDLGNFIDGNAGANDLSGLDGDDTLDGHAGDDNMSGGLGNDSYFVDSVDDHVTEEQNEGTDVVFSSVSFTLSADVETLNLQGTADANATGNAIANTISGNSAANILAGFAGHDILTGGLGSDTFVISTQVASADTITDFIQGTDTLMFQSEFIADTNINLFNTQTYVSGSYGTTAEIVFETTTGNLYFDVDGSDAANSGVVIATLAGFNTDLTTGDFSTATFF